MLGLGNIILMFDRVLDSDRKRHITAGILISLSMMLAGFTLTVMTIKKEDYHVY